MQTKEKNIRVQLVNATTKPEIQKMLRQARNERRVTLDLDEVVFGIPGDFALEGPRPSLRSRLNSCRIRKGIPFLFTIWKIMDTMYGCIPVNIIHEDL